MKKIISLLIIFTLILTLASCNTKESDPSVPKGMKLASNSELCDYNLFVPESWIVDISTALTTARVSEGDSSSVSVSAFTNAAIAESDTILEEYWKTYEEELIAVFDKDSEGKTTYAPMGDFESITVKKGDKNVAAHKHSYSAKLADNDLRYIQVIIYDNAYFYIITFTTSANMYKNNIDAFNNIIANFTLD